MSIFEIGMLLCFGAAWPISIWKSYTSRTNDGKSSLFLWIVLVGYVFGCCHKVVYNLDPVLFFYIINLIMVALDILLYYRNKKIESVPDRLNPA